MSGPGGNAGRRPMAAVQEEIAAEMAGLNGLLQKYEYLVCLGRGLQPGDALHREEYAVPGCQSRVWIRADLRDGRLRIDADSDAMIIRGIIALLLRVLDDRTPAEILDGELFFLDRTGLGSHLSPARANGLAVMVGQIRSLAEAAASP
jgi:cysteine desulfuration protein SufE